MISTSKQSDSRVSVTLSVLALAMMFFRSTAAAVPVPTEAVELVIGRTLEVMLRRAPERVVRILEPTSQWKTLPENLPTLERLKLLRSNTVVYDRALNDAQSTSGKAFTRELLGFAKEYPDLVQGEVDAALSRTKLVDAKGQPADEIYRKQATPEVESLYRQLLEKSLQKGKLDKAEIVDLVRKSKKDGLQVEIGLSKATFKKDVAKNKTIKIELEYKTVLVNVGKIAWRAAQGCLVVRGLCANVARTQRPASQQVGDGQYTEFVLESSPPVDSPLKALFGRNGGAKSSPNMRGKSRFRVMT